MKHLILILLIGLSFDTYAQDTRTPFATTPSPVANRYAWTTNGLWVDSTVMFKKYIIADDTVVSLGVNSTGKLYAITLGQLRTLIGSTGGETPTLQAVTTAGNSTNNKSFFRNSLYALSTNKDSAGINTGAFNDWDDGAQVFVRHRGSTVGSADTFNTFVPDWTFAASLQPNRDGLDDFNYREGFNLTPSGSRENTDFVSMGTQYETAFQISGFGVCTEWIQFQENRMGDYSRFMYFIRSHDFPRSKVAYNCSLYEFGDDSTDNVGMFLRAETGRLEVGGSNAGLTINGLPGYSHINSLNEAGDVNLNLISRNSNSWVTVGDNTTDNVVANRFNSTTGRLNFGTNTGTRWLYWGPDETGVFAGTQAGNTTMSGTGNIAAGNQVLDGVTTGAYNLAIGTGTARNVTSENGTQSIGNNITMGGGWNYATVIGNNQTGIGAKTFVFHNSDSTTNRYTLNGDFARRRVGINLNNKLPDFNLEVDGTMAVTGLPSATGTADSAVWLDRSTGQLKVKAVGGGAGGGVQSVTDDGNTSVTVDNTDPDNPIVEWNGVGLEETIIKNNTLSANRTIDGNSHDFTFDDVSAVKITNSINDQFFSGIANSNSGSSAYAELHVTSDATFNAANGLRLLKMGENWTNVGMFKQDGAVINTGGGVTGGLSIGTTTGDLRFYVGGVIDEKMVIDGTTGYVSIASLKTSGSAPTEGATPKMVTVDANGQFSFRDTPPVQTTLNGSGDGVSTSIAIELPTSSTWVMIGAKNAAAAGITYWTLSGTTVTIHYSVAPASGTNNLDYWVNFK